MMQFLDMFETKCPCHEQMLRDFRERIILNCHHIELEGEGPRPTQREPIPEAMKQQVLWFLGFAVDSCGLPLVDFGSMVDHNNRAVPLDDGEVSPPGYYLRFAMGNRQAVVKFPVHGNVRVTRTVFRAKDPELGPAMSIQEPRLYGNHVTMICNWVRDWLYTRDPEPSTKPRIITETSST